MKLIIDEQNEDERIDSYLADILSDISRSKIQNSIKKGEIKVNLKSVKPSYQLKFGDVLEIDFIPNERIKITAEDTPLTVVWEDENMAVVNKPSGMLTHPTEIETSGTLVNAFFSFRQQENHVFYYF